MEEISNFLQSNPWVIIVSFISAVIGIVAAIYAVVIHNKDKTRIQLSIRTAIRLVYSRWDSCLNGFKLKKGTDEIDELYDAFVWIKNTGNKRIDKQDMNQSIPLCIVCKSKHGFTKDIKIIDYKIENIDIEEKNSVSVKINEGNTELPISFEFLEPGEEIIIYIRFAGLSATIETKGNIKSGTIQQVYKLKSNHRRYIKHRIQTQTQLIYNDYDCSQIKERNRRTLGIENIPLVLSIIWFVFVLLRAFIK